MSVQANHPRIIRLAEVLDRTQLSRSTIYNFINNDGSFPARIKLGERSIGFLESEISEWILAKVGGLQ